MQEEIAQLVKVGKLEDAFAILKEEIEKPLSPEDKGQMHTELMSAYLDASNNINKEYEQELQDIGQILKDIKSKEDDIKREDLISKL